MASCLVEVGTIRLEEVAARLARSAVVLVVAMSWAVAALASDKTDVVTLANGDHFTGEISTLSRGRLEFKTDDVGTLEIEWDKVIGLEAVRQFDIATSDGRHFLGSLKRTVDRSVLVAEAVSEMSLPLLEITEITPIGASFWRKMDGSVDAGFTYTRSSGIAQATLNTTTAYRQPLFRVQLTMSATLTAQSGDAGRDDRASGDVSYTRYRGRRLLLGAAGRLETNESLGLVLRSQAGGLVGMRLVNTNRAQFLFGGGMVVNDERAVDAPETQNLEGVVSMETSYYTYDRPKTNYDAKVQYYPSFSNWGRQRLQADSSVKRELWKDFFVGFDLYDTFDSAPPNPDASRNDFGIVISVGWSHSH